MACGRSQWVLGAAAMAVVGVGAWVAVRTYTARHSPGEDEPKPIPVREETGPYRPYDFQFTTDQNIQIEEEKVRQDPKSHAGYALLGGLYLRKAKNDGDHAYYDKAGVAFTKALEIIPGLKDAQLGLAFVHGARHEFAESLKLASAVYKDNPDRSDALSMIADAHLELGDYAATDKALKELEEKTGKPSPPPALLARQARLAELRGDPDKALALLATAAEAQKSSGEPVVNGAWYGLRRGEILFGQGKLADAATLLEAARRDNPVSPEIKAVLAQVWSAQGKDAEAVALFAEVVGADADTDTWVPFGHVLMKAGDADRAKAQYALAEGVDKGDGPVAVRDLILYYCDTDGKKPRALQLARRDAAHRKDVLTCDMLAWALLANGEVAEAEKAAADALRLGTKDALLLYHAGAIAHAAGKPDAARDLLKRALATNPYFSHKHAAEAKKLLATLDPPK